MSSPLSQLTRQTLVSAGTPQKVTTTTTPCYGAVVYAESTNTGTIYIGGASVTTTSGLPLTAGQSLQITTDNEKLDLSTIWWDGGTTGDKLRIVYKQRA